MDITVIKQDIQGNETWRYTGQELERDSDRVLLEALFNREDTPVDGIILKKGDRFIETYYTHRWYNIYEIHDGHDGTLKGWYCNVSYPARLEGDRLYYKDLALDLLVFPDGRQVVLDEDEFEALPLSPEIRAKAREALRELMKRKY